MTKTHIKYTALAICMLLLFASCRQQQAPQGVVDTATFAKFLTEAYIVQSYDNIVVSRNRDSLQHLTAAAYDSIYHKYGITRADYDSTVAYYLRHPKEYEEIYARVIANLKDYSSRKQEQHKAEAKQNDTVQKNATTKAAH